jgi:hypothetical protein
MTAHTPGPWTAVECDEGSQYPAGVAVAVHKQSEPWKATGAICHMVGQGDGEYSSDVTNANARLIAAAPALLEAAKAALQAIEAEDYFLECAKLLRAAIKQAEGGAE